MGRAVTLCVRRSWEGGENGGNSVLRLATSKNRAENNFYWKNLGVCQKAQKNVAIIKSFHTFRRDSAPLVFSSASLVVKWTHRRIKGPSALKKKEMKEYFHNTCSTYYKGERCSELSNKIIWCDHKHLCSFIILFNCDRLGFYRRKVTSWRTYESNGICKPLNTKSQHPEWALTIWLSKEADEENLRCPEE